MPLLRTRTPLLLVVIVPELNPPVRSNLVNTAAGTLATAILEMHHAPCHRTLNSAVLVPVEVLLLQRLTLVVRLKGLLAVLEVPWCLRRLLQKVEVDTVVVRGRVAPVLVR